MKHVVVFLDIDGVLHPYVPGQHDESVRSNHFAHLPRLESVLRDFPGVDVVVTSDGKRYQTLEELRSFFSKNVRPRIVGTTALVKQIDGVMGRRQERIEEDLNVHGMTDVEWIAIDDEARNYRTNAPMLLCTNCFTEVKEARLRGWLVSITAHTAAGDDEVERSSQRTRESTRRAAVRWSRVSWQLARAVVAWNDAHAAGVSPGRKCAAAFEVAVHCGLVLAELLQCEVGEPLPDRVVQYLTLESPLSADAKWSVRILQAYWEWWTEELLWEPAEEDTAHPREHACRVLKETRAYVQRYNPPFLPKR